MWVLVQLVQLLVVVLAIWPVVGAFIHQQQANQETLLEQLEY